VRKLSIVLVVACCCAALARGADEQDKDAKSPKNLVTIKDRKYVPATLTIKAGETVTWVNKDDHDHTVDATGDDDENRFASGNLTNGDTFKHKFPKAGKFKYTCSYHPRMKGTIVVVDE
jgi:plastocyanin